MIPPITGRLDVTLDSVTLSISPHRAFFSAADAPMRGVLLLAVQPNMNIPYCFLAGQTLECLLKAYLSKKGVSEKKLTAIGHNIPKLWKKSDQGELPITSRLPQWAKDLSRLHQSPYNLRYPLTVNGLVLPSVQPMTAELEALLEAVRQAIK